MAFRRRGQKPKEPPPAEAPPPAPAEPPAPEGPLPPQVIPFVEPPAIDAADDTFTAARMKKLSEQIKASDIEVSLESGERSTDGIQPLVVR